MKMLPPFQREFIKALHGYGGVSLDPYAAAYHRVDLIDEAMYNRDVQAITDLRKGSLRQRANNLAFIFVKQCEN